MNPTSIHEDVGLILGLAQRVGDPELLWLWCRPAAVALIQPLTWELPHATGVALKCKKKKKNIKKGKRRRGGRKEGREEGERGKGKKRRKKRVFHIQ